ncbi:MAG: hypothetical protein G01um101448_524 [Parcubacteria group bacterium Gr01-1014_48]|nr:MAG: hypothetical protein Greene041614_180 [Parcubacteria group bacterium Greene0416_14]TSC73835.1 MAG: hypothetical protein G01um101448_524 [Parcubacteria group bacterium Gr01-1014_48]TSD01216.1 MAG: hypothetical protein Greene101415_411 [Parcubacteria group bacterium Greene1014_15]TSD08319.1 MAG: hypothetical protein Greene07144_205 [Parcubacteria group bacterium Greene0714_4]
MKKIHSNKIFWIKVGFLSLLIVPSLFLLNHTSALFAQVAPKAEICNGIDDNGDGVIDENANCDHYLSYLVDKPINPVGVVLHDQFIDPTDFTVFAIERLLNPVRKLHQGLTFDPKRPGLHYLAYRLSSPVPFTPRSVFIENQFERQIVSVTKPRYLLTPTGKRKTGIPIEKVLSTAPDSLAGRLLATIVPSIPQNANHYLCYNVEPYAITKGVSLRDQFQIGTFKVIRALYLCNPVEKTHNGKRSEIIDERNHLMCYEVLPHNPLNRPVLTHDQFGVKSLKPVRTEEICVPTVKTHLTPDRCVQPDDHGTAVLLDSSTKYQNTLGQLTIVPSSLVGTGLMADVLMQGVPTTVITRSGTPASGETYVFETEMLSMSLSGGGRVLHLPVNGEIGTGPRTPGDPVQSFDTDMRQLQGQLPDGDPDFDLLRITAGSGNGLPSPGHTTLTAQPDGSWAIDSFFDITYRIDFVGAPGGPLAGQSGSHTGTLRLQNVNTCTPAP